MHAARRVGQPLPLLRPATAAPPSPGVCLMGAGLRRLLALAPSRVICDEPMSALAVSIQARVVNLLQELQDRLGLGYRFIAHRPHPAARA